MLSVLRNKETKKKILLVTIALVAPGFLFWGTESLMRSKVGGPAVVGVIGGRDVPIEEFRDNRIAVKTLATLNYGNDPKTLDSLLKDKALMARLAWERLVTLREARWRNIKVSDAEVIRQIRSHPAFNRGGRFDGKIYAYALRNVLGVELRKFEEIVREGLETEKLNDMITKDVAVSDDEVELEYRKENEKFRITYILVSAKDLTEKITVDEPEARDYYEKHKVEFALPERGEKRAAPGGPGIAYFEDVRDDICSSLSAQKTAVLVLTRAQDIHKKIKTLMEEQKATFTKAAGESGFKTIQTPIFSRMDQVENIGQGYILAGEAAKLKAGEISSPLAIKGGTVIFALNEIQVVDPEKLKEVKAEFSKKLLKAKKDGLLQKWVWSLELRATVNADLAEIE